MKKLMICAGLAAVALAVPAQAHNGVGGKPAGAGKPDGVGKRQAAAKVKSQSRCTPRKVGYNARGVLVSHSLTQTAGQGTTETGDDRYSGDVEVDVKRANHKAPKGVQEFTLTNGRVNFYDANDDGTPEQPSAGDVVKLHGKITRLNKRCDANGFTPTVTLKRVQFKPAPTT